MIPVFEEVKARAAFWTGHLLFHGPEHTDAYYVKKVGEILDVTGPDILLAIKNHGGLGTPKRIGNWCDPSECLPRSDYPLSRTQHGWRGVGRL